MRTRGLHATILPDDRLLVSYPRSGITWVSFLLTNLTQAEPTTFLNLEERCPDMHKHDDPFLLRLANPRLMKTHRSFDPRFGRVLYLVRDPRDVVLSYHRYRQKVRATGTDVPIERFVDAFLDGTCNPGRSTWGEHVGSWCGARAGDESFLVLRYEDFHAEPTATLARAAEFLRIPASSEACETAVARASAEQMRQIEQREMRRVPGLMESRLEIPFIGPAEVGRGRRELSERDQERLTLRWGRTMAELGYS